MKFLSMSLLLVSCSGSAFAMTPENENKVEGEMAVDMAKPAEVTCPDANPVQINVGEIYFGSIRVGETNYVDNFVDINVGQVNVAGEANLVDNTSGSIRGRETNFADTYVDINAGQINVAGEANLVDNTIGETQLSVPVSMSVAVDVDCADSSLAPIDKVTENQDVQLEKIQVEQNDSQMRLGAGTILIATGSNVTIYKCTPIFKALIGEGVATVQALQEETQQEETQQGETQDDTTEAAVGTEDLGKEAVVATVVEQTEVENKESGAESLVNTTTATTQS